MRKLKHKEIDGVFGGNPGLYLAGAAIGGAVEGAVIFGLGCAKDAWQERREEERKKEEARKKEEEARKKFLF